MAVSIARNSARVLLGLDVRPETSPPICQALALDALGNWGQGNWGQWTIFEKPDNLTRQLQLMLRDCNQLIIYCPQFRPTLHGKCT
jgi:hypothetical protein